MCGIIACISRKDRPVDSETLLRAGKRMVHRGPDAQGIFMHKWAGLLHNRLSIIDLSKEANQPFLSSDKRYAIIYNGEIYNYKELKDGLIQRGVKFRTNSDTEVLLNLFIAFGKESLNKLRGMFAFAILDLKEEEVFFARDIFGIKPLYIHESDERLVLSSEIKPISEYANLEPDYATYYEQMMFKDVSGERTFYKDIHKLKPGEFYTYKKKRDEITRGNYYDLEDTFRVKRRASSTEEIVDEAEEILTESIKAHTLSDVGYNLQLSGGVDSSLVAAILAKRLRASSLKSFSVSLDDKKYDESKYQDMVAREFGIENLKLEMTNEIFTENLERATAFLEKPLFHMGSVCLFYLTRQSALNSKVILTGEGADETFGGYDRYSVPMKQRLVKAAHNAGVHHFLGPFRRLSASLDEKYFKIKGNAYLEYGSSHVWYPLENLMARGIVTNADTSGRESLLKGNFNKGLRGNLLYYNQRTHLNTLLDRQDRMSMANSVEARVPYTDKKVYEFANSLPESVKFRENEPKFILKKVAERYLPGELIYKRKNGLGLPLDKWLEDKRYLGRYLGILTDETARRRDIYDMKIMEDMVKKQAGGGSENAKRLTSLIAFELWHKVFFDRKGL